MLGSINWLKHGMETRQANPNVVRNIIYRDKGRLEDKRVLFSILNDLWQSLGNEPLHSPELEVLLSPAAGAELEVMQLLGREKMQAYRRFIGVTRTGSQPRLLVTGRPGSGKTLLSDTVQQALEIMKEPRPRVIRLEFHSADLAVGLTRLAAALHVPPEELEARLVKVGASSAFAVQADAQADVARLLTDTIRASGEPLALLLHISQSLAGTEHLGLVPLRLNTDEVPRTRASEWLWLSLLEPLSRLPHVSLLVSMTEAPARVLQNPGGFEPALRLNPPTVAEARRFVRARLPHLTTVQQEALVQQSSRSFEELRTLTLLAEIREPISSEGTSETSQHVQQLARLADTSGDTKLRDFLGTLSVVSLPDYPDFPLELLQQLRESSDGTLSSLEQAFLDPVPARSGYFRAFSRHLARQIQQQLQQGRPEQYRELQRSAAEFYAVSAEQEPQSEAAARYLQHLFEAREWDALESWLGTHSVQQSLLLRIWEAARKELRQGRTFLKIALRVASHYVKLNSHLHPDVAEAFEQLSQARNPRLRAWTTLKQAEGALLRGWHDEAEAFVSSWESTGYALLDAEAALIQARIHRWRGQLDQAARLISEQVRPLLTEVSQQGPNGRLLHARASIWAALVAKDQGDLHAALDELAAVAQGDELIEARVAYQRGDILLRLGGFDAALRQFDLGVDLAQRSEALISEQTRFLSRRGRLHGLRGDFSAAGQDFHAVQQLLLDQPDGRRIDLPGGDLEREFWLARSNTDRVIVLLARSRFPEAIFLLHHNLDVFERYTATFKVDTSTWRKQSTLYLVLAYFCRGTAQPYRLPLQHDVDRPAQPADIRHARKLLAGLASGTDSPGRVLHKMTRLQLMLESLLASEPPAGVAAADQALQAARCAYDRAQAHAYAAFALLRGQRRQEALERVTQAEIEIAHVVAPAERSDLGLRTWLIILKIRAHLGLGELDAAGSLVARMLAAPVFRSVHELLLRSFGEASEESGLQLQAVVETLSRCLPASFDRFNGSIRLPDALVAAWRQQAATADTVQEEA